MYKVYIRQGEGWTLLGTVERYIDAEKCLEMGQQIKIIEVTEIPHDNTGNVT